MLARAYGAAASKVEGGFKDILQLEGEHRQRVLESWAGHTGLSDPWSVARAIKAGDIPKEDATPQIVRGVTHYLLQRAPEEAKAWAISLPEQDLRKRAVSEITSTLLEQDSESGSKWVLSLEEGVSRDWAAKDIVSFLTRNGDLESARIWKEQIVDKSARTAAEGFVHEAEERAQGIER